MKLLITGASGFLGRYFITELLKESDLEIWGVTRTMGAIPGFERDDIHWLRGDLCSLRFCREAITSKDVILHLAHTSYPLTSEQDLAGDIVSSLLPSANLLQAMAEVGSRPHLVFASSGGAVYGSSDSDRSFTEDDPCFPGSAYGVQKLMIEHYIRLLAGRGELSGCVLRITNAYGTLLPADRRQGLVGVAMARILSGKPITIFGSLGNVRDYVHLQDVYHAVRLCFDRREAFEVFNIGSGKGTSVSEVLGILERVTGRKPQVAVETSVADYGLVKKCVVNPQKASHMLGWHADIDLEHGIQLMFDQWQRSAP